MCSKAVRKSQLLSKAARTSLTFEIAAFILSSYDFLASQCFSLSVLRQMSARRRELHCRRQIVAV